MAPAFLETELGRVAVAGSGFLADGFDLYIIGQVQNVLEAEYTCGHASRSDCVSAEDWASIKGMLSSAALFGAVIGQLTFGSLADRLGRRAIFITTGALIICGSLLSACVFEAGQGPNMLLYQLVFCRALLGFGIGGEYPLSATICAEGTAPRRRATLMSLVFANQGLGYLLSASLMCLLAYLEAPGAFMWRFALAFGAAVPLVSMYFRMAMHESEAFEKVKAARASNSDDVSLMPTLAKYKWHLLGTAGNWFIFDIVFYANSLFNGDVTSIIQVGPGGLKSTFLRTLLIVLIMLPGYLVGLALINALGRKATQVQGYVNMAVWFGVCGFFYRTLKEDAPALFLIIYGLTFFFSNFGPNLTTYVVPGEIYPSHAKATLHGISAACGKMGAFLGALLMPYLTGEPVTENGIRLVMFTCAGLALVGLGLTLACTPSYQPEDLVPKGKFETVGFVPLRCQQEVDVPEKRMEEGEATEGGKSASSAETAVTEGCSELAGKAEA